LAAEDGDSRSVRENPLNEIEQRSFTGTVGADKTDNFTRLDRQIDIPQNGLATIIKRDMIQGDNRICHNFVSLE
jgi:hypothetical protein